MRHLVQPGPIQQPRIDSIACHAVPLAFTLAPGRTLLDSVAGPLLAAGFASATLVLRGGGFGPFAYVLPAPSPDAAHAAWYSAPWSPPAGARLDRACVTFGLRDGRPWLHCHAAWEETDGRRGGHVLPEETVIAAPVAAEAWGLAGAAFVVGADAETQFTLFQPAARPGPVPPGAARAAALRIRPNEDLGTALEAACRRHGFAAAVLRGGVGSLVGARFAAGGMVEDYATEMFVDAGRITPGAPPALDILLADMRGQVHEGVLVPGDNAVCITFEGVLEEITDPPPAPR